MKQFKLMPDDPFFEKMDPLLRNYLYFQWCEDKEEDYQLRRNIGILIGSFSNPEAAKEMLKAEDNTIKSSEEDFEKSLQMVREQGVNKESKHRRRRKVVKT